MFWERQFLVPRTFLELSLKVYKNGTYMERSYNALDWFPNKIKQDVCWVNAH